MRSCRSVALEDGVCSIGLMAARGSRLYSPAMHVTGAAGGFQKWWWKRLLVVGKAVEGNVRRLQNGSWAVGSERAVPCGTLCNGPV